MPVWHTVHSSAASAVLYALVMIQCDDDGAKNGEMRRAVGRGELVVWRWRCVEGWMGLQSSNEAVDGSPAVLMSFGFRRGLCL